MTSKRLAELHEWSTLPWAGSEMLAEALAEVERLRNLAELEYKTIQALHQEIAWLRERLDEPSGYAEKYSGSEKRSGGDGA